MRTSDSSPLLPATQTGFCLSGSVVRVLFRIATAWALCLAVTGCGGESPQAVLQQAEKALRTGDLETARTLADSIPADAAEWNAAQLIAGKADAAARTADGGLSRFAAIRRDGSPESLEAAWLAGGRYLTECRISAAVDCFEYVLLHRPDHLPLRERLATIFSSSGLRDRAAGHQLELLKQGQIGIQELVALTAPDRPYSANPLFRECASRNAGDPFLAYAAVFGAYSTQRFDEARQRARAVVAETPDFLEAQSLLGELLIDGSLQELQDWYRQLPAEAHENSGVRYVLGQWAQRLGERDVAVRCYWEALVRAPHHRRAAYQLGQLLSADDGPASAAFLRQAERLREYSQMMERALIGSGTDDASLQRIIALLIEMGRDWEAYAWASLSNQIGGQRPWLEPILESLAELPGSATPRFQADRNPARQFDCSQRPDFDSLDVLKTEGRPSVDSAESLTRIAFEGQSTGIGIDFAYDQSPDTKTHGVRIFESTGGGAGVLDFDHDGWPDLYLTQGEPWPPGSDVPEPSDRHRDSLYRNRQTDFADVALRAGLQDDGYGQGCSCGDFNNDGFADLYVANVGRNQLLLNNGDGTFSDVTLASGIDAAEWTTSCLVVDLNADGLPDLYDVNYLRGENIFAVECARTRCSVRDFPGARDCVWLSQGDLTWRSVPDAAPEENAKGLGIVTVYLPGDPRPSLFIANDQVPNFFLRPTATDGRYADSALSSGLSVNRDGQPTACMGVAAADLNRDGALDLFVTNFEGEANNLYLQRDGAFFEDAIAGSGLLSAGLPYVGWGTQFLDADNDGDLDLVVANGHVADFGEMNVDYQMPLQFFRNVGGLRFELQTPEASRSLFQEKSLGRTITRFDWNRDGLPDFVTTRIGASTQVATNRSQAVAAWLDVRLHAVRGARDASGAVVTVNCQGAEFRQQLIRGDGYQASNDPVLHFGLGDRTQDCRVTVTWPSGTVTELPRVPVRTELLIVEGGTQPAVFRGDREQPDLLAD